MLDGWDDEQLLAALSQVMKARAAVPAWFTEMGKNAYAWHNIDAELAQLTYDSRTDADAMAAARSETATIRALTFTSAHLSIELEVADGSLLGQVVPPQPGGHDHLAGGRSRVLRPGAHPAPPVPVAVPHRRRRVRDDGVDHAVTAWLRPRPAR